MSSPMKMLEDIPRRTHRRVGRVSTPVVKSRFGHETKTYSGDDLRRELILQKRGSAWLRNHSGLGTKEGEEINLALSLSRGFCSGNSPGYGLARQVGTTRPSNDSGPRNRKKKT